VRAPSAQFDTELRDKFPEKTNEKDQRTHLNIGHYTPRTGTAGGVNGPLLREDAQRAQAHSPF